MTIDYIWTLEQEAEKLERNDSKISLHILLKEAATKKIQIKSMGSLFR